MLHCGDEKKLPLRRPLSIHRVDGDKIALLFKIRGKGTRWLSQLRRGKSINLLGPLGNGFSIDPLSHNLLLVAGGIGAAPLRFLIDKGVEHGKKMILLMGACSEAHLLPDELCIGQETGAGIDIMRVTEDGSCGYRGLATEYIEKSYTNIADQVFICGPMPMYHEIAVNKHKLGLEGKKVQVSLETRMGCGLGICYSCTIRTIHGLKQVCKDGPVFYLDDIIWDEFVVSC
jgi:dihydroorotate dehydrogenase electron transfer subunit